MSCKHDEDGCKCYESISEIDTSDLIDELKERGVNILDQQQVEEAYEGLLRGDTALAKRYLGYALNPTGGFDGIAHRVRQDLRRQAPGAHGQVGQSSAEAERTTNKAA